MRVSIVIPTRNRAGLVCRAIDAALAQTHPDREVLVIDDASTDATWRALERYAAEPDFAAIRLGTNGGTSVAKNLGLMLAEGDAVTFHDSDDVPAPEKIARQVALLDAPGMQADPMLNWAAIGRAPGGALACDLVLTGHVLTKRDGSEHRIERSISLVEDFFPNLQINSGALGDWVLINSGLFRRSLFTRLGGFADSIEEDRDLRNRVLLSGGIVSFIPEPLLHKYECADSLTVDAATDYRSARRDRDRTAAWQRIARRDALSLVEPVDCRRFHVADIRAGRRLALATDLPRSATGHPSLAGLGLEPTRAAAETERAAHA